ncbi:hypothetical protein [Gracilinema caldarium]|uniref:Uncharacterized protein n=1 Tax=Gracilinema caldarium (strain ATCC 51460 / DSM 7334 / H1) TaxID=744872 RepID=F8EXK9_GRAC1|nr:hypothetical protein [Gracilinema caldarium]AEJ19590.1 hypothetical protein Spica_1445 [Gracilinema caldarium DSM 7334]
MKRIFILLIFITIIGFDLQAETIFVSLLEQTPDMKLYKFESSSAWESGVLDALFDMGIIVSNTPIENTSSFNIKETLQLARQGGADSVLVAQLTYAAIPNKTSQKRATPEVVHFYLYSVKTDQLIKQYMYTSSIQTENPEQDKEVAKKQTQLFINNN